MRTKIVNYSTNQLVERALSGTPVDYAFFGGIKEKYKRHPVQVRDPFLLESVSL